MVRPAPVTSSPLTSSQRIVSPSGLPVSDLRHAASVTRLFPADQPSGPEQTDFRQLRHQTKNALQRLMCEVWRSAETQDSPEGRRVFEDLQRRLSLSAEVSDALFGFTGEPGPLEERLRRLCEGMLGLLATADQTIELDVYVEGDCPDRLDEPVLRVAHEMVGNAIKHGMHARLTGRIDVVVTTDEGRTRLVVIDDGWGFGSLSGRGQGLPLMHDLAQQHAGTVLLRRADDLTQAELDLPHDPTDRAA